MEAPLIKVMKKMAEKFNAEVKARANRNELDSAYKLLTEEQKKFIELVKIGRKDPVFFANKLLGLDLHDGQKLWLYATTKTQKEKVFQLGIGLKKWSDDRAAFDAMWEISEFKRNILVPSNRWGKTFVTSVKHIWYNFYKKGARGLPDEIAVLRCGTLNLSPHSNQCQAGYDYVLDILQSKFVYNLNGESIKNKCLIEDFLDHVSAIKRAIFFKNGTSYKAVPTGEDQASSLAGTPYLYISYDECAQSSHLQAELPAKIMSRLIDFGGPLDLVSTPEVDRPSHQYFFHIAKKGMACEDGWWTLIGKLSDNGFLGEKESRLALESIKATDPAKYRQVAFGEFITTGKKMFDSLLVERIWDRERPERPEMDHKYLLTADWGFSDTGDPTVFYVLDYTDLDNPRKVPGARIIRIAYRESIKGGSPFAVMAMARMLQREWNGADFIHDATALGGLMIKKMLRELDMQKMNDFAVGENKVDMLFTLLMVLTANRQVKVDEEGKVIDLNFNFGRLRGFYIPELESQMGNYQYNPDKGVSDKKLEQDDIMSLGMGIWWLEKKYKKMNVKSMNFNPLANSVDKIFFNNTQNLKIKTISLPERRIF